VITAQPGGEAYLQKALIDRGMARLPDEVELVSDPSHALLVRDAGDIFLIETQDKYMGDKYKMVQPALVVIHTPTGRSIPELTWSWKTMKERDPSMSLDESAEVAPGVELVAFRPVIKDLHVAVKERRPVKVAPVAMSMEEIEAQCKKYGDWA